MPVAYALVFVLLLMGFVGCTPEASSNNGAGGDVGVGDGDADADGDSDSDGYTDNDSDADGDSAVVREGGLFLTPELLDRARERAAGQEEPFATSYSIQSGRAQASLDREADPFALEDMSTITFGWCGSVQEGTLADATSRLERQTDWIRTLALQYAITREDVYGDKALSLMRTWAEEHTPVNIYDFNPDFSSASLDGQTEGFCSDRPWNFALDAMWQTYGLINGADAYLLLTRNGFELSEEDDALLREWLLSLTEAVNSSFHAWTRWADHHPSAGSYARYRTDNHLSWSLAGLIAAAAALEDEDLASYVLHGGSWVDRRAGEYQNPSYVRDVIARAIEGDEDGERGRLYEERILRDPPIGYSLFHLWALVIVAQVAEVHFDEDLWTFHGPEGGSIEDAFDRYAAFVLGERESPRPDQDTDLSGSRWHYEIALHQWAKSRYREVIAIGDRHRFIVQSWGPLALLFGE